MSRLLWLPGSVQVFQSIAEWKKVFPALAIRNYVISGAESCEDVDAVVQLAKLGGVQLRASSDDPGADAGAVV